MYKTHNKTQIIGYKVAFDIAEYLALITAEVKKDKRASILKQAEELRNKVLGIKKEIKKSNLTERQKLEQTYKALGWELPN